jgi:glycerophosphoryl diester phosphodiesterase
MSFEEKAAKIMEMLQKYGLDNEAKQIQLASKQVVFRSKDFSRAEELKERPDALAIKRGLLEKSISEYQTFSDNAAQKLNDLKTRKGAAFNALLSIGKTRDLESPVGKMVSNAKEGRFGENSVLSLLANAGKALNAIEAREEAQQLESAALSLVETCRNLAQQFENGTLHETKNTLETVLQDSINAFETARNEAMMRASNDFVTSYSSASTGCTLYF